MVDFAGPVSLLQVARRTFPPKAGWPERNKQRRSNPRHLQNFKSHIHSHVFAQMAGLVTATTSLVDETVTLFIPATPTATARPASPPFISLPDAAPLIVSKYTVGPAVLFLILFLVVSIGLSWRIHVTPKTENARRVMISAAVYGWGELDTSGVEAASCFLSNFAFGQISSSLDLYLPYLAHLRVLARPLCDLCLQRAL